MNKKTIIISLVLLIATVSVVYYWVKNKQTNTSINNQEVNPTITANEVVNTNTTDTFSFGVQGDSHPEREGKMFSSELYKTNLRNVVNAKPNFYLLMGDDFSIEKLISSNNRSQQSYDQVYLNQNNISMC